MSMIETFMWGLGGSVAVEVANLYQIYQSEEIVIPVRYKRISFWVVRIILAFMAGGLALAYNINTPLLALNIGASTPLILHALSKGINSTPTLSVVTPKRAKMPKP